MSLDRQEDSYFEAVILFPLSAYVWPPHPHPSLHSSQQS